MFILKIISEYARDFLRQDHNPRTVSYFVPQGAIVVSHMQALRRTYPSRAGVFIRLCMFVSETRLWSARTYDRSRHQDYLGSNARSGTVTKDYGKTSWQAQQWSTEMANEDMALPYGTRIMPYMAKDDLFICYVLWCNKRINKALNVTEETSI
jgi:hypothetical protein